MRDKPTNMDLIAQYINNLNSKLSKQVLVKVQVLEINLTNAYNYGIDWGLIANAFNGSKYLINANFGTPVSITALAGQNALAQEAGATVLLPELGLRGSTTKVPSYTVLVNALSQQGKVSIVNEPRVVCLNNQVSVIRITSQEGYVASIQTSSLSGSTNLNTITSQVNPGNLITGLTLFILPKILKNKVYLQVSADLSSKVKIVTFGPSGSQIQLPTLTAKHFNQRSLIHSGDTLILSGFRQLHNETGAMQFLNAQALGGKASTELNTETIVLITPIILGSA